MIFCVLIGRYNNVRYVIFFIEVQMLCGLLKHEPQSIFSFRGVQSVKIEEGVGAAEDVSPGQGGNLVVMAVGGQEDGVCGSVFCHIFSQGNLTCVKS